MSEPRVYITINGVAEEVFEALKLVLEIRTIGTGDTFYYAANITPMVLLLSDDVEVKADDSAA